MLVVALPILLFRDDSPKPVQVESGSKSDHQTSHFIPSVKRTPPPRDDLPGTWMFQFTDDLGDEWIVITHYSEDGTFEASAAFSKIDDNRGRDPTAFEMSGRWWREGENLTTEIVASSDEKFAGMGTRVRVTMLSDTVLRYVAPDGFEYEEFRQQ